MTNRLQEVLESGIGPFNLLDYLNHPKVTACGGSWMVKSNLIAAHEFDKITSLTREAMDLVQKAGDQ